MQRGETFLGGRVWEENEGGEEKEEGLKRPSFKFL
jgi:hypothetical protein